MRLAVVLLWAGVAFGIANIAVRSLLIRAPNGEPEIMVASPLIIAGLVFIFAQSRLIMRLAAGNGAVRRRVLMLAVLRLLLFLPNFQATVAVSVYLIVPPLIAAILQFAALVLLYTPPGAHWFKPRN